MFLKKNASGVKTLIFQFGIDIRNRILRAEFKTSSNGEYEHG